MSIYQYVIYRKYEIRYIYRYKNMVLSLCEQLNTIFFSPFPLKSVL